jgi:exosortase D (VPLPA-CTERM-specific)
LLFMIPPPHLVFNAIAFPLQGFAARVAQYTLWTLGVPVLREGNVITLANTALEVAEACSGLRSLVTLMAVAATFACVAGVGRWRGLTLVTASIPIAIVTNAARVAGTGILAYHYGPAVAEGFFHTVSGWLLFLVAAALLGLVAVIVKAISPKRQSDEAPPVGAASPETELNPRGPGLRWRLGLSAGLIAVALVAVGSAAPVEGVPLRRSFESFPDRLGAWQGAREALPPSILDVLRVTDYVNRLYVRPSHIPMWLYVAYYEIQRDDQVIHSPKLCLPGGGWSILAHRVVTLTLPGRAQPATINRVLISKESERQLVLYWYQERGRIIADEYTARLYALVDAIRSRRSDGALVRITAPVVGSEEATLAQMLDFVNAMYVDLAQSLPE